MLSMRRITSRKRPTTSALAHPRSAIGMARQGHKRCVAGGNRHGYAGYEFEPVTAYALWHVRYRVLIADVGSWPARDPVGYADGASQYVYVRCKPIVFSDSWGLAGVVPVPPIPLGIEPSWFGMNTYGPCGAIDCFADYGVINASCPNGPLNVVAEITRDLICTECCNQGSPGVAKETFYELWASFPPGTSAPPPVWVGTHRFTSPSKPNTNGFEGFTAKPRVVCGLAAVVGGGGWNSPSFQWSIMCCGRPNPPNLTNFWRSTPPVGWNTGIAGPAHQASVVWNCKCCSTMAGGCGSTSVAQCDPGPKPTCP